MRAFWNSFSHGDSVKSHSSGQYGHAHRVSVRSLLITLHSLAHGCGIMHRCRPSALHSAAMLLSDPLGLYG